MSTLTEYREQKRRDADAAAERRRQDLAAAARRRRQDQVAATKLAAQRRQERRDRWAARRAALPDMGMSALWATMIVLPITLAWAAQANFALHTLQIPGPWNHAFPAAIETGAWLCAFEAHRRIRRGLETGSLQRWMWVLAGVAAVINAAHGITDAGPAAGLALGALSMLGVLLHSIRQSLDAAAVTGERRTGSALRLIRYPRLSFAAASIRAARDLDAATAWRLAWEDRYGVGPDSNRRNRTLARLVVRREAREDRKAARKGELVLINGQVQRGFALQVRHFIGSHDRAAMEAAVHAVPLNLTAANTAVTDSGSAEVPNSDDTHSEQRELSARARELQPALWEAIANGTVPPKPSVKTLRAWARDELGQPMGVPTAQELRDAVSGLRVIETDMREVV